MEAYVGPSNSFIIWPSNSCAACTSLGDAALCAAVAVVLPAIDPTCIANPTPSPAPFRPLVPSVPWSLPYSTSKSASSAPAAFMAWRIEITSRAPAPVRCNSSTKSSTVAPSFKSILFTGLSCACTVVCSTTCVVPGRQRTRLRDFHVRDHVDAQSAMQNRNRMKPHCAPDHQAAQRRGVWPRFRGLLSFHFRKYPRERSLRERDGRAITQELTKG